MFRFPLIISLLIIVPILFGEYIEFSPKFGVSYDSNPYSIAPDDESQPLEIIEDIRTDISLDINSRIARLGKFSVKPSVDLDLALYAQNTSRSFFAAQYKITAIRSGFWTSLSYRYVPEFAIFPVADADDDYIYKFPTYSANRFRFRNGFSPVDNVWLELSADYQMDFYDKNFIEYDNWSRLVSFGIRYDNDRYYAKFVYGFEVSKARGYDQLGESKYSSGETDGSYNQDQLDLRLGYRFGNTSIFIDAGYDFGYYTTQKSVDIDPIHASRKDTKFSFSPSFAYDLGSYTVEIDANFVNRKAESDLNPDLSKRRDYTKTSIGASIDFEHLRFKF